MENFISSLLKKRSLYSLLICGLGFYQTNSEASIVDDLEVGSPRALSLANAVTADPPGIYSIHFNPAGLAKIKENTYTVNVIAVSFDFHTDFLDHDPDSQKFLSDHGFKDPIQNTSSDTKEAGIIVPGRRKIVDYPVLPIPVVPTGGIAWHSNDSSTTFGTAVYAPFGAGYIRDKDDPGHLDGEEFAVYRFTYASPTVAIQLNPQWAVGAGIGVSWAAFGLGSDFRVPNIALAAFQDVQRQVCPSATNPNPNTALNQQDIINFCGGFIGPFTEIAHLNLAMTDPRSVSVNLGVLWEPTDWFAWGASYISEGPQHLQGEYTVTYSDDLVNFLHGLGPVIKAYNPLGSEFGLSLPTGQKEQKGKLHADLDSPSQVSTGIKLVVLPNWQVNFDLRWMDWAKWDQIEAKFDQDMDFSKIVKLVAPKYAPNYRSFILPRNYKSNWNWSMGLEHKYSSALTLRAGVQDRKSSIPTNKADVILPLGDGILYTGGAEYKFDEDFTPTYLPIDFLRGAVVTVGVGYMHATQDVPGNVSANANSTAGDNFIYNPYAGLHFKNDVKILLMEAGIEKKF